VAGAFVLEIVAVMPGLVPGIDVLLVLRSKTWMAGTSPAMTKKLIKIRRLIS
jgi:hypothetical protein